MTKAASGKSGDQKKSDQARTLTCSDSVRLRLALDAMPQQLHVDLPPWWAFLRSMLCIEIAINRYRPSRVSGHLLPPTGLHLEILYFLYFTDLVGIAWPQKLR